MLRLPKLHPPWSNVEEPINFVDCPEPRLSQQEIIGYEEARHAEEIHIIRQEAHMSLNHQVTEIVADATIHVETANGRAMLAEQVACASQ